MALRINRDTKLARPGLTQIKIFSEQTASIETLEEKVNKFLQDKYDSITVKDIKYTAVKPNPNNSAWNDWTVMVIYEEK